MFTQILTSLGCGLQRHWNHSRISELARTESANNGSPVPSTTCLPVLSMVLFYWVLDSPRSLINWELTVPREMSLSVRSSCSRVLVSLPIGDEDELEDVEQ